MGGHDPAERHGPEPDREHPTARRQQARAPADAGVADAAGPPGVFAAAGNQAITTLLRSAASAPPDPDAHGAGPLDPRVGTAIEAERGGGAPLPDGLRAEMEHHLGVDLGPVRLHTGSRADTLSRSVQAEAFTTGPDVFFAAGRYAPATSTGRELLAHELTHVAQQATGSAPTDDRVTHPDDASEHAARGVARDIAAAPPPAAPGPATPAPTAPASTAPVSTDPAPTGPAPTGPGTAVAPAPVGPAARGAARAVQRHNSYEHMLLGDTKPADVAQAKVLDPDVNEAWRHLVEEEYARVTFFTKGAERDPREEFPQTRWIQLGTSKLWVSSGELSAFGDYLPNPDAIDTLPATTLIPILQRMRQVIARAVYDRLTGGTEEMKTADADEATRERNRKTAFAGAVGNDKTHLLPEEVQTIQDLDAASASLGPNRQKGLMSRNACHFAPFSWERWALYHNEARRLAGEAHRTGHAESSLSMRRNPSGMSDAERMAWINNGYANHFLQDSFAAGHLINKTLVMQWFVEYNSKLGFADRPHFGVPDEANAMTTGRQPGIADRRAYDHTRLHTTAGQDHADTTVGTDPQTTMERGTQEGRFAGSGLRSTRPEPEQEYQAYAKFLNSAYLNLAANDIHDYFNARGLKVQNKAGQEFVVAGDGTLLLEDESAIEVTLRADSMTDDAIRDLVTTGATSIGVEKIFGLFPSTVVVAGKPYPLERWNDEVMKQICIEEIFPEMAGKLTYKGARLFGKDLLDDADLAGFSGPAGASTPGRR
ncbi:MAG: hypothetical protein V7637_6007 [Mycobacteriales bacterium]